jgi:hypothetical protein
MFSRPVRNPRLIPIWVTEQYVKVGRTVLLTRQVGNTNWTLVYPSDAVDGSAAPPTELLQDYMYLQYTR